MKRLWGIIVGLILLLGSFAMIHAASNPLDADGASDPPMFNRMPGYYIYSTAENDFSRYEFKTGKEKTIAVEGRYWYRGYAVLEGAKVYSPLAIVRNYENAFKSIGGQVVFEPSGGETVVKVSQDGTETWVYITTNPDGKAYDVFIIEKQSMEQDVVANADTMAQSIKETGKATLYGIYFDTGKAIVKPESEPALKEIAKLLQTDPKLKLYVVGHTDNTGSFEGNLKLSKDRADAVSKALTAKYGINPTRLLPFGNGPVAPVASNATEEGRAKNRRVELVAQ